MGIYSNGTIYGIKIYTFEENAHYSTTLYEQVYDTIMTDEQKHAAYVFYNELSDNVRFQVYTECMSTLEPTDNTTFKNWWSISLEQFLNNFNH